MEIEKVVINKNKTRDTSTIASLGMFAYRIFADTQCINIQLLTEQQEECTLPFKEGEVFTLRNTVLRLSIVD